jgi:hypothetical protein
MKKISREIANALLQVAVTHDSRKMRWDFSKPRELRNMIADLEHQSTICLDLPFTQ